MNPLLAATLLFVVTQAEQSNASERSSSEAPATLGIGLIVHEMDGAPESFDLHRYLLSRPVTRNGEALNIVLVDHPSRATYSVTGVVVGELSYAYDSPDALSGWGLGLTVAGLCGTVVTFLAPVLSVVAEESTDVPMAIPIGTGIASLALIGGGQALLQVATHDDANVYRWKHSARLVLRRGADQVGETVIDVAGSNRVNQPSSRMRGESMEELWRQTRAWLQKSIDEDNLGGAKR